MRCPLHLWRVERLFHLPSLPTCPCTPRSILRPGSRLPAAPGTSSSPPQPRSPDLFKHYARDSSRPGEACPSSLELRAMLGGWGARQQRRSSTGGATIDRRGQGPQAPACHNWRPPPPHAPSPACRPASAATRLAPSSGRRVWGPAITGSPLTAARGTARGAAGAPVAMSQPLEALGSLFGAPGLSQGLPSQRVMRQQHAPC